MPRASLLMMMAALLPLPFLALGPFLGGAFSFVALAYMTGFAFLVDESVRITFDGQSHPRQIEMWIARAVPFTLALGHMALVPLAIFAVAGSGEVGLWPRIFSFAAFGLFFGTISTANAHELIHRPDRLSQGLGRWVFISILFGHHVSAHLSVHHRHAATPLDPNTARLNESFYRFFPRAWLGSYRAGLQAENLRLTQAGLTTRSLAHPYFLYVAGAVSFLGLAAVIAGAGGVAAALGLAFFAQVQLLLSDYVQHYGLERSILKGKKYEPVSIHHSWNAPHVFTSALMLNAPRHSDHHAHPMTPYPGLRVLSEEGAPMLPRSVPVMSCIALYPAFWRRVMNPRVAAWVRVRREE